MKGLKGFTLIELLVALSIIGILASVAMPSIRQSLADQRVKSAAYNLKASIDAARGESMGMRRTVEMWSAYGTATNPWNGSKSGTVQAPNSTDSGRLANNKLSWFVVKPGSVVSGVVATLANSDNNQYPVQVSLADSVQITTSMPSVSGKYALRFLPFGTVAGLDGVNSGIVIFRICDAQVNSELGYTVIMNQFGSTRVSRGPVSNTGAVGEQTCT